MILVDECRWWWRDQLWCHMVSDVHFDELHDFAATLGVPRRGFQGDHYDIPTHVREIAIVTGAVAVSSRELVLRLRAAGLRLSPAQRRANAILEISDKQGVIESHAMELQTINTQTINTQIISDTAISEATIPTIGATQPIHSATLFQRGSKIA